MLRLLVVASLAVYLAEAMPGGTYADTGYAGTQGYGRVYAKPHNGYESGVNRNNAERQLAVNAVARSVGGGTGTATQDGVPGTPLGRTGYDKYSYGNRAYGQGSYGQAAYGQVNSGYGSYGQPGYGGAGYGANNAGYGNVNAKGYVGAQAYNGQGY